MTFNYYAQLNSPFYLLLLIPFFTSQWLKHSSFITHLSWTFIIVTSQQQQESYDEKWKMMSGLMKEEEEPQFPFCRNLKEKLFSLSLLCGWMMRRICKKYDMINNFVFGWIFFAVKFVSFLMWLKNYAIDKLLHNNGILFSRQILIAEKRTRR